MVGYDEAGYKDIYGYVFDLSRLIEMYGAMGFEVVGLV